MILIKILILFSFFLSSGSDSLDLINKPKIQEAYIYSSIDDPISLEYIKSQITSISKISNEPIEEYTIIENTYNDNNKKLGEHHIVFEVTEDELVSQLIVYVQVVDITPPNIVMENTITLKINSNNNNILDKISINDNVDILSSSNLKIVNSTIDFETPGTYTIILEISDNSGNKSQKQATIIIENELLTPIEKQDNNITEKVKNYLNTVGYPLFFSILSILSGSIFLSVKLFKK
ncbi:MAG: cadherin repeat domain-containing protein [Candidatus Izimaplasma sp.]|nr:cadherin repeat domain-containing protein [Candidatus Izimaplasma bacterium]